MEARFRHPASAASATVRPYFVHMSIGPLERMLHGNERSSSQLSDLASQGSLECASRLNRVQPLRRTPVASLSALLSKVLLARPQP